MTTEVEVFNGKRHPIYWDWQPGTPLPAPIGFIDDTELFPGQPEFHQLSIPHDISPAGRHWFTIQVNADIPAGLRDDFVLKRIEAHESVGAKIGW